MRSVVISIDRKRKVGSAFKKFVVYTQPYSVTYAALHFKCTLI